LGSYKWREGNGSNNFFYSVKIPIKENDSAGDVHDHLMVEGAKLLAKTVGQILEGEVTAVPQADMIKGEIKDAPKIYKGDCQIDWKKSTAEVHNKIRGMAPYPTAWTKIQNETGTKTIKLFKAEKIVDRTNHSNEIKIDIDLYFGTADGWIKVVELQLEGKKRMKAVDFIKGFSFQNWILL
jgi:methionyl-tRNA formyltransferase